MDQDVRQRLSQLKFTGAKRIFREDAKHEASDFARLSPSGMDTFLKVVTDFSYPADEPFLRTHLCGNRAPLPQDTPLLTLHSSTGTRRA